MAARGLFGNVIERHFTLDSWLPQSHRFALWGVQTTRTPGGPCRLNCPTAEVEATFREFAPFVPVISPMISAVEQTRWAGDIWDGPTGLTLHGLLNPAIGFHWRREMLHPTEWRGTAARSLLRSVLNDNSYDDLNDLIERYPGHVYELSAFEKCVGTLAGRNHLVWEVRAY